MLQTWRKPTRLFGDFNTPQFASVMSLVVFVVLLVLLTTPTWHHTTAADVPKVLHPVSMPGAAREDAMKVTITRDGKVYFGVEQVRFSDLTQKISDRMKDPEVDLKVYIVADMREVGQYQTSSRRRLRRWHPSHCLLGRSAALCRLR